MNKKRFTLLLWSALIFLSSCHPKITSSILKSYPALDYKEEVYVISVDQTEPSGSEEIGEVKIGDNGLSANCSYETIIEKAKMEARKVGGNAIKITKHTLPSAFGSSCHQIIAKILKIKDINQLNTAEEMVSNVDYATIHIYRYSGVGSLINYDLHLGDTVICRVRNNFKTSVQIKKDGLNSIWAKTESKAEVPVNLKPGREYFVRCSVGMGAFVGRPILEMVDPKIGKQEFESFKAKNK